MTTIFIHDDLLLRPFKPGDAEELFHVIDSSRVHLRQWLPWVDKTLKTADSLHFINESAQLAAEQQGLALAIVHHNKIKGCIAMHEWDHSLQRCKVGYWISKDIEGTGIAYRCAHSFIGFLFSKLNINKVEIHFLTENSRSANMAKRLDARIEGIIRQSKIVNGSFRDIVIAGILKSEWK